MLQKFLNDAKRYYEAGLEEVDFKKKSEAARVDINTWVEKNTQGENQHELVLNFTSSTLHMFFSTLTPWRFSKIYIFKFLLFGS